MNKVGIIGAGASGLFAAINIDNKENEITILEKNNDIGKKILMTGNGRCNITNASFYDEFLDKIINNKMFMYSSFNNFDNYATMDFYESHGLSLVTEEENRVFPKSQKATDVVKFFEKQIVKKNIKLVTEANVTSVIYDGTFKVMASGRDYEFDRLIIATGGCSYPGTGSSGDGYKFAKSLGHKVSKTYPSLVPIFFMDKDLNDVKALSLDEVTINIKANNSNYKQTGPVLLTKNFITGPAVLSLSALTVDKKIEFLSLDLSLESTEDLDKELIVAFDNNPNKNISNVLKDFIPQQLVEIILKRSGLNSDIKANKIRREQRQDLVENIKNFSLEFDKFGSYNTAVITKGGVEVDKISPKTMESKIIPDLYFIGEVLDLDAMTGGYNLQIAFTTAKACADAINKKSKEVS